MDLQEFEPYWIHKVWGPVLQEFRSNIYVSHVSKKKWAVFQNHFREAFEKYPHYAQYFIDKLQECTSNLSDESKELITQLASNEAEFYTVYDDVLCIASCVFHFIAQSICELSTKAKLQWHSYNLTEYPDKIEMFLLHKLHMNLFQDFWPQFKKLLANEFLKELKGDDFDQQMVQDITFSIVGYTDYKFAVGKSHLPKYFDDLEEMYIHCIQSHFRPLCEEKFASSGPLEYTKWAQKQMIFVKARIAEYFQTDRGNIQDANIAVFFGPHKNSLRVLDYLSWKIPLSSSWSTEDVGVTLQELRLTASILVTEKYTRPLVQSFMVFIHRRGLFEMIQKKDYIRGSCERYLEVVYRMKSEYQKINDIVFNNHPLAEKGFSVVFRFILMEPKFHIEILSDPMIRKMNPNPENVGHAIFSVFVTKFLRKSAKNEKLSVQELFEKSERLGSLIEYLLNPDEFMKLYEHNFKRRILFNLSTSLETEKKILTTIYERNCLFSEKAMTSLLMLADLQTTEESCNLLVNEIRRPEYSKIHLKILNSSLWAKNYHGIKINIPEWLGSFITDISNSYQNKYSKRKLVWNHHMSHGTVSFSTNHGTFDLEITGLQLSVLWLWNNSMTKLFSFRELKFLTGLSDTELRKTLMLLVACSRLKEQIILCSTNVESANEFTDDTYFYINDDFALIKNGKRLKKGKVNLMLRPS